MAIELDNSFTVPVPPEQAWQVLLDVERIAPCMPGASVLSVDGDSADGTHRSEELTHVPYPGFCRHYKATLSNNLICTTNESG